MLRRSYQELSKFGILCSNTNLSHTHHEPPRESHALIEHELGELSPPAVVKETLCEWDVERDLPEYRSIVLLESDSGMDIANRLKEVAIKAKVREAGQRLHLIPSGLQSKLPAMCRST